MLMRSERRMQPIEMSCTDDEKERAAPLISQATPHDRKPLIEAMNKVSQRCTTCILATLKSVCGNCVTDSMHIWADYAIPSSVCLPELATNFLSGQVALFRAALAADEPFGLSVVKMPGSQPEPSDLYLPTGDRLNGNVVYQGIDSRLYGLSCANQMWGLFTSSPSQDQQAECTGGLLTVDLSSGQATETSSEESLAVSFHLNWDGCLPADLAAPPTSESSSDRIACWLYRRFGPQALAAPGSAGVHDLYLPGSPLPLHLRADVIIRDAVTLRITGEATRISLGKNRFRVAIGGAIALEGLYIERSEESSALWIQGSATATNVTFRHCYVEALAVVSSYNSLLDHDGAYTSGKGAAIRLDRDASMELTGCLFHNCEARGGSGDASGGACRAQFSAFYAACS